MKKNINFFGLTFLLFIHGAYVQAQNDTSILNNKAKSVDEIVDTFKTKVNTNTAANANGVVSVASAQELNNANKIKLIVEVYDKNTMKLVDGVEVYLFSRADKAYIATKVTEIGKVSFMIENKKLYEIRTCKNGYQNKGMAVTKCDSPDKLFCLSGVLKFYVGPPNALAGQVLAKIAIKPISKGQTMALDNVYYDLGKATLRPQSMQALNKVYQLLMQYNSLVIEVSSHTDSRGGADFNKQLSSKRAKACYNYLVDRGILADRIKYKGYGETALLNTCADGVTCTDSQHQKNRRTEIAILEIEQSPCKPTL